MTDWSLDQYDTFTPRPGPVVVVVLDGVGIGRRDETDAVFLARTPTLDWLDQVALRTQLRAHGTSVGMPSDNDMGNSEVGHNAIGAGRVFAQGAKLVANAVASGALFEGETWRTFVDHVKASADRTLHFMGLLSDGNVHSHIDHLFAMVRAADAAGVTRLRVHTLTDGRDVGEDTALEYITPLESLLSDISGDERDYRIASGGGRMIVTMDRYNADWSIVERGWNAHVRGNARPFGSATEAIETLRREDPSVNDQFLPAWTVVDESGDAVGPVRDGDAVIFYNFRGDRAIEITRAFEDEVFDAFDRGPRPDVLYAGMMQYDGDLKLPSRYLVEPPSITKTLGEYLARLGHRQLAVSETQKYGHVTYFWNGNRSGKFSEELETYIEIPSDNVDFSERPWMKAAEITDATINALREGSFDMARINYPNGDMVGHTGNIEAAIIAVEASDLSLKRLLEAIDKLQGVALITADHGNADQMVYFNKDGSIKRNDKGEPVPMTSHTLNPVPFWVYDPAGFEAYALNGDVDAPGLANIAATVLTLMGYVPPEHFEPSLVTLTHS